MSWIQMTDGQDTYPMGFPADTQPVTPPPGLESTTASVDDGPSLSNFGRDLIQTIKQDSEGAVSWGEKTAAAVYQGTKNVIGTVVSDVEGGIKGVVGAAVQPASDALKETYVYLIGGIVVLGIVVYYLAKTGAFKVSANV